MTLLFKMAWRNLSRNPRRTLITVSGLALGLALAISTWVLFDGFLATSMDALISSQGHVLVEHPGQLEQKNFYDTVPDSDALLQELEADPRVEHAEPQVTAAALLSGDAEAAGATVLGVDLERTRSRRSGQVAEGRWIGGSGEAVLGDGLALRLQVTVGDEVTMMSQAADGSLANAVWIVVGLVNSGSDDIDRSTAWIEMTQARGIFALDGYHSIALRLVDGGHAVAFVRDLDQQERFTGVPSDLGLEDLAEGVDPYRTRVDASATTVARSWKSVNPMMGDYAEVSEVWSLVTIFIVLATAAMGAMNTMLMSVLERTRELGVLMATGLRPPHVVGLIVLENLALSVWALGLGLVLGAVLSWLTVEYGFDVSGGKGGEFAFSGVSMDPVLRGRWSVEAFAWPTVLLGVVTLGASVLPATRAALLKPVDAMRAER